MKDINDMIAESNPQPTPCEMMEKIDQLTQKVSALCKERDELAAQVRRLEAENRAKEQYIADHVLAESNKKNKDYEWQGI